MIKAVSSERRECEANLQITRTEAPPQAFSAALFTETEVAESTGVTGTVCHVPFLKFPIASSSTELKMFQ